MRVTELRKREEERRALAAATITTIDRDTDFEMISVQPNVSPAYIYSDNAGSSDSANETNENENIFLDEVEATMAKFLVHLMSPDGGKRENKSSVQTVQEVRTVVRVLDNKVYNLVNRYEVRDRFFRDYLDKKCKPGTSKHYMSSLISFIDFAISENLELPLCTNEDYTVMKLFLYKWRKVYNKEIDERKWVDEADTLEALVTSEQKANFDQGASARNAVKLFGRVVEDKYFVPTLLEFTNMRDCLMTVIALANAHRSGVSANMKLEEFRKAK